MNFITRDNIVLVYVHDFEALKDDYRNQFNGHLRPGRVYRSVVETLKGKDIYRIKLDDSDAELKGMVLNGLEGDFEDLKYRLDVINEHNTFDFRFEDEDIIRMAEWETTEHSDFISEVNGAREKAQRDDEFEPDKTYDIDDVAETILSKIYKKDGEFSIEILNLIDYLSSTYDDKYEDKDVPNFSKDVAMSGSMGKGANMFSASKYIKRYMTSGYEKSENPTDLYKAIHYLMFEHMRKGRNEETN